MSEPLTPAQQALVSEHYNLTIYLAKASRWTKLPEDLRIDAATDGLFQAARYFKPEVGPFKGILYVVVRSRLLDLARKLRLRGESLSLEAFEVDFPEPKIPEVSIPAVKSNFQDLAYFLAKGFSISQIARILNIPSGTVKSQIHRMRAA